MAVPPASSPVPPSGHWPRFADAGWLVRYALRGMRELVRARIVFARLKARDIPQLNQRSAASSAASRTGDAAHLARIAYTIPRLSRRLPWRSDCLIQAIAAQNWLMSDGLASEIQIGVERPDDKPFAAHAWLAHAGMIVTGGDITAYQRLLGTQKLDTGAAGTSDEANSLTDRSDYP